MTTLTNISDIQVRNDLFKEVKYYVTGTIDPEVRNLKTRPSFPFIYFINLFVFVCLFIFQRKLDSKIA